MKYIYTFFLCFSFITNRLIFTFTLQFFAYISWIIWKIQHLRDTLAFKEHWSYHQHCLAEGESNPGHNGELNR